MLAIGVETINKQTNTTNKQAATMAYKIHKIQPQRAQEILKQPPWLREITITINHNGLEKQAATMAQKISNHNGKHPQWIRN